MDREFLSLYNHELRYLNDHAGEFAREFPGIAERLGGLTRDAQDPLITGLLEGAAFLAARVQLKLKHEFHEFTSNYIEQLLPDYLAPTPSALMAAFTPGYGDAALREGQTIASGSLIDATYLERERRVACRYQLRAPITLWPLELTAATHLPSEASLHALGINPPPRTPCGLSLKFRNRTAAARRDEPEEATQPGQWVKGIDLDALPIHLVAPEADAVTLYEQILGRRAGVWVRFADRHGDPVAIALGPGAITPLGLTADDFLIPETGRVFRGFHALREYFWFAHKFLGFTINGLQKALSHVESNNFEIVFGFSASSVRLPQIVAKDAFALYAAPAVNLFAKSMDRVSVTDNRHEFHVVPDRTHPLDYEPFRIEEVYAHHAGGGAKVPVLPLYSASGRKVDDESALAYTVRRLPRKRSSQEERTGRASTYAGTELFVSLSEPAGPGFGSEISQISLRGLCSNRHLTEQLPVGEGGVDFTLLDNTELDIHCVAGPTPPRPPVVAYRETGEDVLHTGSVAWRLVNFMSLNQRGLAEADPAEGARTLKSLLTLFADPSDAAARRRIEAIRTVESRPIVRRIRSAGGFGAARGLEVTVTVEENAFEGSGAYLMGVVLNKFFAEYVSINRFTQTVLRSVERGEIQRWAPVFGERPSL
ncbi:type VI secretion system baseplate subunit TssF [Acuticoccus sp. MNP-M23]|uniref:type VI secretion system baseplate subunit TssF n=1 Tax=Acuticoccus sp. MNP-M23 TaxID=3072793 RepID=UPI002814F5B7|nr:type VI secretion system baseplate subunit TssF [Acuticoccus sp. MNP-M23]WMS44087.1 type VI secretion system baseplate subunit TssF [Acuticoccus sp. MNP-M23]